LRTFICGSKARSANASDRVSHDVLFCG
jgi:hypothetical protein